MEKSINMDVIEGVFCDFAGTLYPMFSSSLSGDELEAETLRRAQIVVELLLAFEKEGKKITIWSGGISSTGDSDEEIAPIKEFLGIIGIGNKAFEWPMVSKFQYRGKCVEVAIDDDEWGVSGVKIMRFFHVESDTGKVVEKEVAPL